MIALINKIAMYRNTKKFKKISDLNKSKKKKKINYCVSV